MENAFQQGERDTRELEEKLKASDQRSLEAVSFVRQLLIAMEVEDTADPRIHT